MKNIFPPGSIKTFIHQVNEVDLAQFESGLVHPVYATFALGRDAEWCCRLFVLEMKEEDEEGIGTFLNVEHVSPAFLGSEVKFVANLESVQKNEVICSFQAFVGERLIAKGTQGQKILKKEKLKSLFSTIQP